MLSERIREEGIIMLKDIVGVKFIGGNFASLNELRLLDPTDGNKVKLVKGSILYGRNGSGKSTIAKAVKKLIVGGGISTYCAGICYKQRW